MEFQKNEEFSKFYGNHNHHGKLLNEHFELRHNGFDWLSPNMVRVEFKENFCECKRNKRFMIRFKDIIHCDLLVFNNCNRYFYVCLAEDFAHYGFKDSFSSAQPYLTTIKNKSIEGFRNIRDLKSYLSNLTIKDVKKHE